MVNTTKKDIEFLVKSKINFLQQLNVRNTGVLFGIGDLVEEIIKPLSSGTSIPDSLDFLLEVFSYMSGLEYLILQRASELTLDLDKKVSDNIALLQIRSALGYGKINVTKKLLRSLQYYDEQLNERNIFSKWCRDEAVNIQRSYQIEKDYLQKMPESIYKVLLQFLSDKKTLTRGEELYVSFLNESIGVALERIFNDLDLIPVTLYSLRLNTSRGVKNTYCKYCHSVIHRGDAGDSCTKKDNRTCFERNIGSRTKRRSKNELIFIRTKSKVCVSCGVPLEYAECRIVDDTLLCKSPKCYESLKYNQRKKKGLRSFPKNVP